MIWIKTVFISWNKEIISAERRWKHFSFVGCWWEGNYVKEAQSLQTNNKETLIWKQSYFQFYSVVDINANILWETENC